MSRNKRNIQEMILGLLRKKRAVSVDDLTTEIEDIIESEEPNRKVKPRYVIARTIKHLGESGMLKKHETEQSAFLEITPEGRHKLRSINLSSEGQLVPTKWDGQWRVVILDIPEENKKARDALRYILKKANFVCLKNSVWISPYPLEHLLSNMKTDLGLSDELIIIVTDKLDPETKKVFLEKYSGN